MFGVELLGNRGLPVHSDKKKKIITEREEEKEKKTEEVCSRKRE